MWEEDILLEGLERDAQEAQSEQGESHEDASDINNPLLDFGGVSTHTISGGQPLVNHRRMLGEPDRPPETHEEEQQYLSALGFSVRTM